MMAIIDQMLSQYEINSLDDEKNALKEVVQEVTLCALSRAGFFKEAAFYGGTALRIFYGLNRFSEDLDFSLITPNKDFDLSKYFTVIEKEINSVGLNFQVEGKEKTKDSNIKSAFLKGNTKEHILSFYKSGYDIKSLDSSEITKVKFEVDINPPPFASFENKYGILPSPYQVRLYDLPSLFAGKIHAIICRKWKHRTKGRDLYDYLFYISRNTPINMEHLKARLIDSNYIDSSFVLNRESLIKMLNERFKSIDYESAKSDVSSFIKDVSQLEIWGPDFFYEITKNINC